jgi:hypothetical protein
MSVRESHEMACPECNADSDVYIDAVIRVRLLPYGEIDRENSDLEWTDTSPALCVKCGHVGEVQDFALDRECEP